MVPTDYGNYKQKREAQLARERAAKEIADRLARDHAEEEAKRRSGAAIAPPKQLIEQDVVVAGPIIPPTPVTFTPPVQFGKNAGRGLGVAANIMSKFGYKEGKGLGRMEQGMSTALRVEKVGRVGGNIVAEEKQQVEVMEVDSGEWQCDNQK